MKGKIEKDEIRNSFPRTTVSLCPVCKKRIPATIFEEDGKVMIEKECPEHRKFKDVYWSDAEMYLQAEKYSSDGKGVSNPRIKKIKNEECPFECGLCNLHLSHTCLANLDLTNRCNLRCPICFANATAAGYVYELSYEQVVEMMKELRNEKPVPCSSIQFSGGEPTIHPDFLRIIRKARELGFSQIQVATNGIRMAEDPEFCQEMVDNGMHTIYLQFDTLKNENYLETRGRSDLLDVKLKAIENCRKTKPRPLATVLVPTVVKGVNDDEVGEIVKFGVKNSDVIRAVNFQPVSFTGRINKKKLVKQRYTLPDLVHGLEKQTDFLEKEDFYPVPILAIASNLISTLSGKEQVSFTSDPHCGLLTAVYVSDELEVIPIPRFIDIDGFFNKMKKLGKHKTWIKIGKRLSGKKDLKKTFDKHFGEFIDKEKKPEDFDIIDFLSGMFADKTKKSLGKLTWKTMLIGGMHFQDSYNYDINRIMRCVIHYVVPDGRIIPFCAYNGGPTFREEIEKKYSISLEEWEKKTGRKIKDDLWKGKTN